MFSSSIEWTLFPLFLFISTTDYSVLHISAILISHLVQTIFLALRNGFDSFIRPLPEVMVIASHDWCAYIWKMRKRNDGKRENSFAGRRCRGMENGNPNGWSSVFILAWFSRAILVSSTPNTWNFSLCNLWIFFFLFSIFLTSVSFSIESNDFVFFFFLRKCTLLCGP